MPNTELSGTVALVTGGGAGIGRAAALTLAAQGSDIVLAEIDLARAEQTAELVRQMGRRIIAEPTDVSDSDQIRRVVDAATSEFGRIDILVNNAGGVSGRRFVDQSERSWRRHIELNLIGVLAATAAAAQVMIDGGRGGAIVNVVSIEASRAAPMYAVYAACKAGVVNFTKTMALELAEHGIRVNAIAPDWTRTPGLRGMRSGPVPAELPDPAPLVQEQLQSYIPLGREGIASECGDAIAFLCSPKASYITGACIPVDGGTAAASGWLRSGDGWSLFGRNEPMQAL